jgi:hypothetical protein
MMQATLVGYFVDHPIQRGKATLSRLRCRDSNGENKTVGFAAFGKTGDHILKYCYKGKCAVVSCEVSPFTTQVDGKTKHHMSLTAKRIGFLADMDWAEKRRNQQDTNEDGSVDVQLDDVDVTIDYPEEDEG